MPRAFLLKKDIHGTDLASMEHAFPTKAEPSIREKSHPANLPYFPSPNSPWPPIGLPSTAGITIDPLAHHRQPLAPKNPDAFWINNSLPPFTNVYLSIAHSAPHWAAPGCHPLGNYPPVLPAFSRNFAHILSNPLPLKPKPINTAFDIDTILGKGDKIFKDSGRNDKDGEAMDVDSESSGTPSKSSKKSTPRYQCGECKKSYSTVSGLTKHREFHCTVLHQQSFKCTSKSCNRLYGTIGALKMHMRTHTLPNQCTVCGRRFSRPWLLQGHMRTHSGEKPFQCPQCMRPFADRSNLRAHLQTHADIKKYKCDICLRSFSRNSLLNKHQAGSCRADPDSRHEIQGTLV